MSRHVDRKPTIDQKPDEVKVVVQTSAVKRSVARRRPSVNRSTTVEQQRDHLKALVGHGSVKSRVAVKPTFVNRRAAVEQKADNVNVPEQASDVKRSIAITIHFVKSKSPGQQKFDNLNVVAAARGVKWVGSLRRAGDTCIEVQSTTTHVTLGCCTTKPSKVDGQTLLAQCALSLCSRRDSNLHDALSFEPADVVIGCQLSSADLQARLRNVQLGERILQKHLESGQSPALAFTSTATSSAPQDAVICITTLCSYLPAEKREHRGTNMNTRTGASPVSVVIVMQNSLSSLGCRISRIICCSSHNARVLTPTPTHNRAPPSAAPHRVPSALQKHVTGTIFRT